MLPYLLVADETPLHQAQWLAGLGVLQRAVERLLFLQLLRLFDALWLLSSICAQAFLSL
jgi:hypothetical protein